MSETALERTSRALDLIPFISRNPGFNLNQLAEKFNTSPVQIFKDLEMLFLCGLPGYTHLELIDLEISEDYVAVTNPQNLDTPRKMSKTEVISLLLGLELLIPYITSSTLLKKATGLIDRLRSLLASESTLVEILSTQPNVNEELEEALSRAIHTKSALRIEYRSARSDRLTVRTIFPIKKYAKNGLLYTQAFCLASDEERHFRHDRIMSFSTVDSASVQRSQVDMARELTDDGLIEVRALLPESARYFVEEHSQIVRECTPMGDSLLTTFEVGDTSWLLRSFLALSGRVKILHPDQFQRDFDSKVDAILSLYR